jgi:hypothetical protein
MTTILMYQHEKATPQPQKALERVLGHNQIVLNQLRSE